MWSASLATRRDQEAGLEFHVNWANGDSSWEPYDNVKFAEALEEIVQHAEWRDDYELAGSEVPPHGER